MPNKARAGHQYPPYFYEVSRTKIEEYAAATGYLLPTSDDPDIPLVAPRMFAACFTVMRGAAVLRQDVELAGSGAIVHAGQEFDFGRRVASGERLRCTPTITEIVDRGAHAYLTLSIECLAAQSGEHLVTSRQSIAYLGAAAATAPSRGSAS